MQNEVVIVVMESYNKDKKGSDFMTERLSWKQIQEKYPNQWVGLVDVQYMDNDGISVESAVVKYTDKTKGELTRMVLKGEIVSRHTNPDGHLQLGAVGML